MQILVVDDDQAVRDSLARSLTYSGDDVQTATNGVEALAKLVGYTPDAIIMDVMMPRMDGLETTRMLREGGNDVPILILTARDAVGDRVDGLDAGADDYMVKPFALDELLARLRALTRRSKPNEQETFGSELLTFADLSLDAQTREVLRAGRRISLTRTEFALLQTFMEHPRRVLERSWLLNEVWGFDFPTTANSLEVYIGYLRRKTEGEGENRLIHTVRGIGYLLEAAGEPAADDGATKTGAFSAQSTVVSNAKEFETPADQAAAAPEIEAPRHRAFSLQRMLSYMWRESLELRRDPVRATLALAGSVILLFVMGFGINMDVQTLRFAVLDHDQTAMSRQYVDSLAGSRYFIEQPPITDAAQMDRRMRSGELALALEIPPGFARDLARGGTLGGPVQIGAWIDGSMPMRAETVAGYVQGMHQGWLAAQAQARGMGQALAAPAGIETRFRYNPDVRSLPAMVPAVIPMLLMMIPAMLAALAVVREKELGSILNLYVTPVTRSEFLLGKQLPYVLLALLNFGMLTLLAVTVFGVPITGSLATLCAAALLYVVCATGIGLLASSFTRSQVAALFLAMIGTMIPAAQYSGILDPVSSLEGVARWIGTVYPATHFIDISRGVFNKALHFTDLAHAFWALLAAVPVILALSIALLKKQER